MEYNNTINGTGMTNRNGTMYPTCSNQTDYRCVDPTPCNSWGGNWNNCTWPNKMPQCNYTNYPNCTSDRVCNEFSGPNCTFHGNITFYFGNLTWIHEEGSMNDTTYLQNDKWTNMNGTMLPACNSTTTSYGSTNCTKNEECFANFNYDNCTWNYSLPTCDYSTPWCTSFDVCNSTSGPNCTIPYVIPINQNSTYYNYNYSGGNDTNQTNGTNGTCNSTTCDNYTSGGNDTNNNYTGEGNYTYNGSDGCNSTNSSGCNTTHYNGSCNSTTCGGNGTNYTYDYNTTCVNSTTNNYSCPPANNTNNNGTNNYTNNSTDNNGTTTASSGSWVYTQDEVNSLICNIMRSKDDNIPASANYTKHGST